MGFLGSLRYFTSRVFEGHRFYDSHGHGLPHVANGEPTQRRKLLERLHAHWLGRDQIDDGCVTRLYGLRIVLGGLARTTVALLLDLGKFAGDVGSVTIQNGSVAISYLSGVVQNDDLSDEVRSSPGGIVLESPAT